MYVRGTPVAICLSIACACDEAGGGGVDASQGLADAGPDAGASAWAPAPGVIDGAIQETAVVVVDGQIFVMGGFDDRGVILASVRVFDTATSSWSRGVDLPEPIHHANAAVVDGTIYVLGGLQANFAPTGQAWKLQPGVDVAWTELSSMPAGTERGSAAVGVVGGQVILAGGLSTFTAVATVLTYDVAGGTWDPSSVPALPSVRDHGCGIASGGRFFVIGGRASAIGSITASVLELVDGQWVTRATMPTARGGIGCDVIDGHVLVVGGEGNPASPSGVFPQTELYSIENDSWTSLEPMLTPRHGMGVAAWERTLHVPGGATQQGFGAVATHETYTLAPM